MAESLDADYASIQRMFKARDEKNTLEAARIKTETGATSGAQRPRQRTASSRGVSGAHSQAGRRLEQQVRRTRLEDMPERDEFRPSRQSAQTRGAQRTVERRRGGSHLETSEDKSRTRAHSRAAESSNKKTGGVLAGVAGLGGALLLMLNAIIPSAPAQTPPDIEQKAENNIKPIHYHVETPEESDTIRLADGEYSIGYANMQGDIENNIEAIDETVATQEVLEPEEAPYVPIEHVSDNLIDAMKGFEGLYLEAYTCPGGALTIGYGHTADVYEGQTITAQEAKDLLRQDLASREAFVKNYAENCGVQLTQGQFDALVDFAFNLGNGCFEESGLVEMIGDGDLDGAAAEMQKYVYAKDKEGNKVKLGGLVARRAAEAEWLYS